MKIRTDFVTNSSSSNFCVEVKIEDNNGECYSLYDDPICYYPDSGGNAYFKGSLKDALNVNFDSKLKEIISKDFKLLYKPDDETIEKVGELSIGTKVEFKVWKYKIGEFERELIQVIGKNGLLGTLDGFGIDISLLVVAIERNQYDVEGIVNTVKYDKKRKESIIRIRAVVRKKDKTEEGNNKVLALDSVKELCDFLTSSVDDNCYNVYSDSYYGKLFRYKDYELFEYEVQKLIEDAPEEVWENIEGYNHKKNMEFLKASFNEEVTKNIKNISDIKRISVIREYNAWGEYADCISNNDVKLCEHANKVTNTTGEEHKEALKNMLDYINTSNGERGQRFGCGFNDFRYNWEGGYKELEELAERLMRNSGPGCEDGTEFSEIDLETGEYTEYAVFNLY